MNTIRVVFALLLLLNEAFQYKPAVYHGTLTMGGLDASPPYRQLFCLSWGRAVTL